MKRVAIVLGSTFFLLVAPLQMAPGQSPRFLRGDTDASGKVELSDAVFNIGYLFLGSRNPPCLDSADANDSGNVDISDVIYVLSWLYLGGRNLPAPGPDECGPDPTEDGLTCIYFEPCASAVSETGALMILVEYESPDGLVNFAFECQQRGIKPVVLAKAAFVTEHCALFKALQSYGLEIIGWCGPVLWGMPYDEQREMARWTKETIEACTGSPLKAIGTRLFGTDATTCRIAEELGIPYVFARGTTGARATVYKPEEYGVKIISVSTMESAGWAGGLLSDWSVWARSGTPADFRAEIQNAIRHDRITPVVHTRLGGLKKAWHAVIAEQLLDNPHVRFLNLDEFAATADATLPIAKIPENRKNPYGPMEESQKFMVNLQVTEYQNTEALQRVVEELEKNGIEKTTIFASQEVAAEVCPLLSEYDHRGHEIAAYFWAFNGERVLLNSLSRTDQLTAITEAKESLEICLSHRVPGFRSMQFSQNEDTNEIVRDLGLDWHGSFVAGRGLPGHEGAFIPYPSIQYGFFVISMVGAEVTPGGSSSALCDTALRTRVENAGQWSDLVKNYFIKHRDHGLLFLTEFHPYWLLEGEGWWDAFADLARWLGEQDAEYMTTAEMIERCSNQYGPAPAPAVPFSDEPNVDRLWTIAEFPEVPGSPTVGSRIVFFHNGAGRRPTACSTGPPRWRNAAEASSNDWDVSKSDLEVSKIRW